MSYTESSTRLPTEETVYLNTGQAGKSPSSVIRRITETLDKEVALGPASRMGLNFAKAIDEEARTAIARFIRADTSELRLTHGTREGLNIVLFGFVWRPDDEIVVCELEHSALKRPAEVLVERYGIRLVHPAIFPTSNPQDVLREFQSAIGPKTRLIVFSHIQFGCGLKMPAREIVQVAHAQGIPVLIDAAQSVGQVNVDVSELGCDFLALSGQKWLTGPVGTGALYVNGNSRSLLNPSFTTNAIEEARTRAGGPLERIALVSQNPGIVAGFAEAINLVMKVGVQQIEARVMYLANFLREQLKSTSATLLSPARPESASGLITIALNGHVPDELVQTLEMRFGIISRTVNAPIGVRFCTAYSNTEAEMKYVAESLESISKNDQSR